MLSVMVNRPPALRVMASGVEMPNGLVVWTETVAFVTTTAPLPRKLLPLLWPVVLKVSFRTSVAPPLTVVPPEKVPAEAPLAV